MKIHFLLSRFFSFCAVRHAPPWSATLLRAVVDFVHRWPKRFLKSGGQEPTKSWPNMWEQICYTLPVLLCWFQLHSRLRLYSRLFAASQLSTAL